MQSQLSPAELEAAHAALRRVRRRRGSLLTSPAFHLLDQDEEIEVIYAAIEESRREKDQQGLPRTFLP